MANTYILIEEDYVNEYCNDFNRCSYFSFFSIYCFAKNQKNEKRRYRRGKEKIKCISYLYNACSSNCYCAYFNWTKGIYINVTYFLINLTTGSFENENITFLNDKYSFDCNLYGIYFSIFSNKNITF